MSGTEFHHYNRDEFLAEFYPDPADKQGALGGRLEIIADFGDQRLAFTEPGTEAA
jgi:hypothetical protein